MFFVTCLLFYLIDWLKEKSKREKKTGEKIWKCRDHGRKLENYGKCFLNHGENCLLMYQEQCNVQYIIFCENLVICPVHLNNTKWLPYKKLLYLRNGHFL